MSLKKSLAWLGAAQALSIAMQFASSVVLARNLTPYEMGISAVAMATVAVLSISQQLSLNALIVREEVLDPAVTATAFSINALMAITLSAALGIASVGGSWFFRDKGVGQVLLVLSFTPLFGIPAFLPGAALERDGRFKELSIITTANGLTFAALTITFALCHYSFMSVAYAQFISSLVFSGLLILVGRKSFSCRLGFSAWRRVMSFGVQMLAIAGVNTVSQKLSEIMLGRLLGLAPLGIYNRAAGLNNLLWGNIHLAIGRVMLVDFAEHHRRGASLSNRYKRTVAIATATLWPAFAGLAIVARPLIDVVYGPQWVSASTALAFIALSSMILVSITMTWELFTATGQIAIQTRIESVRAIISFLLFAGGCLVSIEAAAFARVIDAIISVLLYRSHVNRMTRTQTADFWLIYGKSLVITLVAIAPAVYVVYFSGLASPSGILVSAVVPGLMSWLLALFVFKHPIAEELRTSILSRLRLTYTV